MAVLSAAVSVLNPGRVDEELPPVPAGVGALAELPPADSLLPPVPMGGGAHDMSLHSSCISLNAAKLLIFFF